MRRSLALAGVTTLAMAGFAFGAGPALAADPPPVAGTADCLQAVEATATVSQARDNLAAAQRTLTNKQSALEDAQSALATAKEQRRVAQVAVTDLKNKIATAEAAGEATGALTNQLGQAQTTLDAKKADVTAAQSAVDEAQSAVNDAQAKVETSQSLLAQARVAATAQVCTGPTEEPTQPAPPENPEPTTPPIATPGPIFQFGDDVNCSDFATQAAAQAYFELHRSAAQPDPDHLDANNNGIACEGAFDDVTGSTIHATVNNSTTEINNGTVVTPLADDGSTATTSGNEVTDVPSGSVQTGAA